MLRSQGLFANSQSPPIERFRVSIASLMSVKGGEILNQVYDTGVLGTERLFPYVHCPLGDLDGFGDTPLVVIHGSDEIQRVHDARIVRTMRLLVNGIASVENCLGLCIPSSRVKY